MTLPDSFGEVKPWLPAKLRRLSLAYFLLLQKTVAQSTNPKLNIEGYMLLIIHAFDLIFEVFFFCHWPLDFKLQYTKLHTSTHDAPGTPGTPAHMTHQAHQAHQARQHT